nr:transmembrane prolyl 4-hydroxylase-like [Pocillopora verrucosa]
MTWKKKEFGNRKDGDGFNLNEYGHIANIVVSAKKGKAIMWYNYELDEKTGWMNHRDDRSLHGGCIVKKDIKYIAINMGFSMHLGILLLLRPVAPCGA